MPIESQAKPRRLTQAGISDLQGYCLFEAATEKLVGMDLKAAEWLNMHPSGTLDHGFRDVFPGNEAQKAYQHCLVTGSTPVESNPVTIRLATNDRDFLDVSLGLQRILDFTTAQRSASKAISCGSTETETGYILAILKPVVSIDTTNRTDALTGLPDRSALAEAGHTTKQGEYAVLFADLDGFKAVNDAFGHATGDRVLEEIARRWKQTVRDGDLIVRYGGDEFVLLLPRIATLEATEPIVKRLQRVTEAPIEVENHSIRVSVSIGAAIGIEGTGSLPELVNEADRAMYASKRSPR